MRNLLIAAILISTPFGSIAQDSPLKNDGKMWQTWTDLGSGNMPTIIKAAYVQGAIEGLRVGSLTGYYAGRGDEKNASLNYIKPCMEKGPCSGIPVASLIKPLTNETMNEVSTGANKIRDGYTAQNTSILDIVRQIDKFYADYRNTPVCMIVALQESISSLRGSASSEEQLNMERKGCNP